MMINRIQFMKGCIFWLLSVFTLVYACADDTGRTTHDAATDTCSIYFDLRLSDSEVLATDTRSSQALELDCDEIGTVNADVFTLSGVSLQSGGPWNCDEGAGTIQNVPAGVKGMVVVLCRSPQGDVVYRGESFEIDLVPGRRVSAGTIEADSFVPNLLLPADGEADNVINGNVLFRWEPVESAVSYRLEVVNIGNPGDPGSPYFYDTPDVEYRTHDLIDGLNQYAWRVRAIDAEGNRGAWSEQWTFQTDDNQIPSAQITSPVKNSQVFGNIRFQCSSDAYDGFYDPEDIDNVVFEWTSDVDGVFGTSESFTANLTPGSHVITLAVTDQVGAVGYDEIGIMVLTGVPTLVEGQWVHSQTNEVGCSDQTADAIPTDTCDIASNGLGSYTLTFDDTYICLVGSPCVFSCTQTGAATHSCTYTNQGNGLRETSSIQFSVSSNLTASGQGTILYERDDNGDSIFEYQCEWDYDISFIK